MEEGKLIKLCKKRDKKAFEILVHQYSPMMYNVTKRYTNSDTEAQDALQEAMITVFRSIEKYKEEGNFQGWLKRIAVTSGLKEIRKNKRHKLSVETLEGQYELSWSESPEIISTLALEEIEAIIEKLPIDYKIAFNMYVVEGFSHEEIAEILGIAITTCRMRVSRARKKLYDLLVKTKEYGFEAARKVD